jgi:hypothetical protein
MDIRENPDVRKLFDDYPGSMRQKMLRLRQLVLDTASETDGKNPVEETLKWGEPSYVTKGGSTLRIDWKPSRPDHYALYFHCRTSLVDTFKELYGETFTFDGNRAIVFHESDDLPVDELRHCIALTLTYHSRKHLPLLGA